MAQVSMLRARPALRRLAPLHRCLSTAQPPSPYDFLPSAPAISVTSTDIAEGSKLAPPFLSAAFGVEGGEDRSPALSWGPAPEGTKSFVVSCYDPDAPTVSGFWHWVMYDIPASVTSLAAGAGDASGAHVPAGAKQLKNDAGMVGFLGAAPPPGHREHRYIFAVTALPVENFPIDENTSNAVAHFNMFGAGVLGRGILTAVYGR